MFFSAKRRLIMKIHINSDITFKRLFLRSLLLVAMTAGIVAGAEPNAPDTVFNVLLSLVAKDANNAEVEFADSSQIEFIAFDKESTIQDGLRLLAARCKKNIVPSSKVDGALNVSRLYNVTFEQALEAVLGPNFKYEREGNFIKVYTLDEYKKIKEDPSRKEHKVFTLYYITAEEAAALIKPVLSNDAKLEKSTPAEKSISGGSSGATGAGSSSSSGGGGDKLALNDTIVLYDYPENVKKAQDIIKLLDVRPRQVLVEATILSATLTEGMDLGVDWTAVAGGDGLIGTSATSDLVSGDTVSRGTSSSTPIQQIAEGVGGTALETAGFAKSAGGNGLRLGITSGNVTAFITALETVTDVTILANPKILAVNKQEGSVQIGKIMGYRDSTTIGQGGVATQGEVKFLSTGTVLVFRPYIANDGYIRMDIYPKDSTAQLNADKVPDETTAQLKTNILVKDGQTIIIGGLFRDVIKTTRSQVPVLGNLPILGALFRGTSDTSERQEVMVMLTPHIIEEPSQTNGLAREEDVRRKREGAKLATQGIGRARLADDCYTKAAQYYTEGNLELAMHEVELALTLRPTYLEALRLKERIIAETDPEGLTKSDSIVKQKIDKQEAPNWMRH
jgi:type IV pilus assembly protein PilQ